MNIAQSLAHLDRHQRLALDVLSRTTQCIEAGRDAIAERSASLWTEMATVLRDYQILKHDRIFDPAIATADADLAALAREMKTECIGAGETFRSHLQRWSANEIANDCYNYRIAARLTINQLRRHIAREAQGVAELLARLEQRRAA